MRFLVFLLATYILFLAVKPGIDMLSLQADTEQTCCGCQCAPGPDEGNSQNHQNDTACDGKYCNPFQVCSSCVLICPNSLFDYIPKPTTYLDKGFTYQSAFTLQYASDFWQPPKIV